MPHVERRGSARVPARLAMEIILGGDRATAESLNVSANGVYFSSRAFIPLLTRLRVTLELPGEGGATSRVSCDGVVVRTEPEAPASSAREYQIACYFTEISDADRTRLESYILRHVPF
ncbi:MAG TPA: PilZ domain-containing protein [Candidatus Krumholzibacteria bacterium]|nr:PilZ domain-containing protein [Candidatus Krumholzibacteria bacterium]